MLNKIGVCTFLTSLVLVLFLCYLVPKIETFVESFKGTVKVYSVPFPIFAVVLSGLIAFVARVAQLHNRISSGFGIRKRFDLNRILIPMAEGTGHSIDENARSKLKANREKAMRTTFYRYASFEEPKISKALVYSAMDTWTWYWALAESTVLVGIAVVLLVSFAAWKPAFVFLLIFLFGTAGFFTCFNVCGRKAGYQVEEILADESRKNEMRAEFRKLLAL